MHFDFERVHEVMKSSNWQWVTETGTLEVPSIDNIQKVSERLLNEVLDEWCKNPKQKYFAETGGLVASISKKGHIKLSFVVTEMSDYDLKGE